MALFKRKKLRRKLSGTIDLKISTDKTNEGHLQGHISYTSRGKPNPRFDPLDREGINYSGNSSRAKDVKLINEKLKELGLRFVPASNYLKRNTRNESTGHITNLDGTPITKEKEEEARHALLHLGSMPFHRDERTLIEKALDLLKK